MIIGKTFKGALFFALMLTAASAWAVSSSLWESDSKNDFDSGEPDGVSVMPPGQVVLGPKTSEASLDTLYAWSLAEDSKGGIYAGTGSDGEVFKVSPGGEAEVFAELELQQVFALAAGRKGVLYAGGFPGGKVYSIDAKGQVSEHFDTGQDSVWALCLTPGGNLIAATGDEGQLFKIEADGKGSLLYDSSERRILSLICDAEGNVFAGSEQSGIIYRIDSSGRAFVHYDTDLEEVTSMTMDADGNLYAASSPGDLFMKIPPKAVPGAHPAAAAAAAVQHSPRPKGAVTPPGIPAIPSGKKRTSFIYKIAKDGTATKFWKSPEKLIFSLAFDGENILAGTGDDGIVYLITPDGEDSTYFRVDRKQALGLLWSASGQIAVSTGNDAAVVFLGDGYASEGVFISQVHDATSVSKWGRVFSEADIPRQTSLAFSTRSGNSEKPDDTWSEWSRERGGDDGFVPESPVARFVQWRARLTTSNHQKTPTLRKVTVAYLQTNLAPQVKSITVAGNNGEKKKGGAADAGKSKAMPAAAAFAASSNAGSKASNKGVKTAPTAHKTKLKIKWKANDANGDDLEYALFFKGTDEKRWKLIEDELTEKKREWDTEAVPDGEYHVKLVASDSPSNPGESSLATERVSEPFIVDNTPPRVESLRAVRNATTYKISVVVSDNLSPVRTAQYSIDAGDWAAVFPADGIFDSLSEKLAFSTEPLEEGEHTIVVKAVDYFGNVGAGKITFEVK